ncbi:MAG: lysophospholipid acyltransferase family protein [Acidobacteriota bacterium]
MGARDRLIVTALRAARTMAECLSLSTARGLGALLGRMAGRILFRERRKALRHIRLALPERGHEEHEAIIDGMFEHLGMTLLEVCWMGNLNRKVLAETTVFEGLEHVAAALAYGNGGVFFTGHCGNWEWLGAAIALSGFDVTVMAREIDNSDLNSFILTRREMQGVHTIGRGSAVSAREMLQVVRRGGILGFLLDQNIRSESVKVPFFGLPAPTPIGPAKLAIRSGATVLVMFIERRDGRQFVTIGPPILTARDDDAEELTARITRSIEDQIRRVPSQWVWMHQRWRERRKQIRERMPGERTG